MVVDAHEHISKVNLRIDAVLLACDRERAEDGGDSARRRRDRSSWKHGVVPTSDTLGYARRP